MGLNDLIDSDNPHFENFNSSYDQEQSKLQQRLSKLHEDLDLAFSADDRLTPAAKGNHTYRSRTLS